jgi:uncharacterized protein YheU (UPF0270 family)
VDEMNDSEKETLLPVEVPPEALSADALTAVIESFILREGTDYGREEIAHEKKLERVRKQLAQGDIKLVFDAETESVTFMTKRDWDKLQLRQ